jgi:NAD(P)-dependent dehydrogenase (short-subunit alcohol dehydrogenase family)
MPKERKTVIVTGASQGIGAGLVGNFLERGYCVVANSRNVTKSDALGASDKLALVEGDIGAAETGAKICATATSKFGSIDALVNNAGIFFTKAFHQLHARGLPDAGVHQAGKLHQHYPAPDQTNGSHKGRAAVWSPSPLPWPTIR